MAFLAMARERQAKTFTTAALLRELHLIPGLRPDLLLRSKVNTLKPRFARGTSPPQTPPAPAPPWGSLLVGMFSDSPYLAVVLFLYKSL